jgi:phage terminase large subunit-like protein
MSPKWNKLLMQIPGYDPFLTAGDCWFDTKAAQKVLDFFPECLKHVKGEKAGTALILENWEKAILANLFGWKRQDGTRRYRTALIFIPKKNAKTTLAAGIVIYGLFCEGELGSEIYSAASTRDQAGLILQIVKGMIRQEPELQNRCQIYQHSIVINETNSFYKPLSSEAGVNEGINSQIVVVDELHKQPNRELVDVLDTSQAARRQPLMIYLTTSDYDRPSICNEVYDYACQVRDGILPDDKFLPVIYEAKDSDDWTKPEVWRKANPNYGVSVKEDFIKSQCDKAKNSPTFENTFKRLHLNIKTKQDVFWLLMDKFDECGEAFDPAMLLGRECYGGLDLSSTTDITSFSLIFPDPKVGYYWLGWFWIPAENAEKREQRDRVPYITWARQGLITLTSGNVIDYDVIRAFISNEKDGLTTKYNIKEIASDRWAATQIITQLSGDGLAVVPFGQGYASMSAPTKELEKIILGRQFRHNGNPTLRWMASNVTVEMDAAGNLKPTKKKSTEKIDGIVTTIMGLGRAMLRENKTSVYEQRGVLVL